MTKSENASVITFADDGPKRFKAIALRYPLMVDGVRVEGVTVQRLRAIEVKRLQEAMEDGGFMFERLIQPFTNHPQAVLDALDQDDFAELAEAVIDFLPEKMRAEMENARAQMEEMLLKRMQDSAASAASPLGDGSLPTSPMPSNGTETSS